MGALCFPHSHVLFCCLTLVWRRLNSWQTCHVGGSDFTSLFFMTKTGEQKSNVASESFCKDRRLVLWAVCERQFYMLSFWPGGPACSPDGSTACWVCLHKWWSDTCVETVATFVWKVRILTSVKSEVLPSFSCVCLTLLASMKNLSERE